MRFTLKRDAALSFATPVSNIFIMEYMPSAPEGYVKVYLYGLMCVGAPVLAGDAASALGMEDKAVEEALIYWQARGLVELMDTDPVTVRYASLSLGAPAPTRESAEFIGSIQGALCGRSLSSSELEKIYDWIDIFGMDEACAVMLARWCAQNKGPKVSVNYMDAVAKSWANAGALTAEAAEAYLADYSELTSGAQAILKRWRMGRRPTEDELALYKQWRGWGFDDAAISAACSEMTGAYKPSFKYLNSILESYRLSGAGDTAAIQELMKKRDAAAELLRLCFERAGIKRAPSSKDIEQMQIWRDARHMDGELILLAADYARDSSQPFNKLRRTLDDWYSAGVKTVAEGRSAHRAQGDRRAATGYLQRTYTPDELKNLGVKLLDDEDE